MVLGISRETLRRILCEGKVSWQATTTWKASNDPDFIVKMHRVLALYDTPPADGRVKTKDLFHIDGTCLAADAETYALAFAAAAESFRFR